MVSVRLLSQVSVLATMILPIQNQLFVDEDQPDLMEAYDNHFANPVIQIRTFIGILVHWVARLVAWVLLGTVWAQIRGDQYNYNINSTVLFNYAVSDTKATQNTIKVVGYGLIMILIWQVMASMGTPIPVPAPVNGGRGRREADGTEGSEISEEVSASDVNSHILSEAANPKIIYSNPGPVRVPDRVKRRSSSPPTFTEMVISALNQNLEPNGIGRNTLIGTVVHAAQFIFWAACTLLPQI